jgi:uncharacterized repeat protein (TIGR03803 family)
MTARSISCKGRLACAVMALIGLSLVSTTDAWGGGRFKTLYRFTGGNDGGRPYVGMIFDPAGNLYGTTYQGGVNNAGAVFELTSNGRGGWSETVLHSFDGADGMFPQGVLVFDKSGNLYGTTLLGGVSGDGTVFKLAPNSDGSWTESIVHSFDGGDGFAPQAGVIFDEAGNLYGTTSGGSAHNWGNAFKLSPNSDGTWTETVLHSFDKNGVDGFQLQGALIFDKHGSLYGTTAWGGNLSNCGGAGCGIVFRLTPRKNGSWKESIIHSFGGADGSSPTDALIFDKAGNLYGTTETGGAAFGTVFELSPNGDGSWTESVLFSFYGTYGLYPDAGVIFDQAGNLYGTTVSGGTSGYGTVFELSLGGDGSWTANLLHAFLNRPGTTPLGGLISNGHGKLYGTTAGDDRMTFGSVFAITP